MTLQASFIDATPTPPGLTNMQQIVYRVVTADEQCLYNAARLAFRCWCEMGFPTHASADDQAEWLSKRGGRMNPETFTRRLRELNEMRLVDTPQDELDRRQRMARKGAPRR